MIRKEIWHGMRAYKATFFIKGYRQRAVAGSHLQYRKLSAVFFNKKFNQRFGIAFSLKWGNCSDILNFKYSIPFVRYDTLAFHSVIIKNIHFTIIEITVNHIFLLIRQQEQIKILFLFSVTSTILINHTHKFRFVSLILSHTRYISRLAYHSGGAADHEL